MVILSKLDLAPPLYGKFRNGLAYGCVPGKVFSVADMRDPHKMTLVAKKIAVWHNTVKIPGERSSKLFKTIHKWIKEGTFHRIEGTQLWKRTKTTRSCMSLRHKSANHVLFCSRHSN